jgi:hypothetical protein
VVPSGEAGEASELALALSSERRVAETRMAVLSWRRRETGLSTSGVISSNEWNSAAAQRGHLASLRTSSWMGFSSGARSGRVCLPNASGRCCESPVQGRAEQKTRLSS